jgi:hypothetical protein
MLRLRRFADQEQAALARWSESCRLHGHTEPVTP